MIDIIEKFSKLARYSWRIVAILYLNFSDFKLEGWAGMLNLFLFIVGCVVIDFSIGFFIRWVYKFKPTSLKKILKSINIEGIQNKMSECSYSEDYLLSRWFIQFSSDEYRSYMNDKDRHPFKNYKFNYITLYNKNNNDKIEVYKTLPNYKTTSTSSLKNMSIDVVLELSYINETFVIKNEYPSDLLGSLITADTFFQFDNFINNLKILFNPDDFSNLMKESSFEIVVSNDFQRNLITPNTYEGIRSYSLNVKWSTNITFMNISQYKPCFASGEIFRFVDYTQYIAYCKNNNINIKREIKERYVYSMFEKIFDQYESNRIKKLINYEKSYDDEDDETVVEYETEDKTLNYENSDDIEFFKKTVIKNKNLLKRKIIFKDHVNNSKYINKFKLIALFMANNQNKLK
jgi:hypothetical protein